MPADGGARRNSLAPRCGAGDIISCRRRNMR